jgi:hypothetical protein
MSLVGLMIILSASVAIYARWGADTVLGGYTKCAIYENYNPKTKINLKAYESITKYNSVGLPVCDISYTPDGRVMDSLVFQYFDDVNRKERISYDMNGKVNFKTSTIRNGNVITEQTISYSSGEKIIDKYIAILDERGNIIESSSGREIDRSNENGEKPFSTWRERKLQRYDEKNTVISSILYVKHTPTDSNKYETNFKPEYDSMGRLIKYSLYKEDGTTREVYTYKYNDDGSKIETVFNVGKYTTKITKFNNRGKETEAISLTPLGANKVLYTLEYDEFGNLTKRNIYFNDKDEVEKTIELVYTK